MTSVSSSSSSQGNSSNQPSDKPERPVKVPAPPLEGGSKIGHHNPN